MLDTCLITREAVAEPDPADYDVETDTWGPAAPDVVVYDGRCQVQLRDVQGLVDEQGGEQVSRMRFVVKLPTSAAGARVGDRVTLVTSWADPELVGRTFRVRDLFHKSFATARRLVVEEDTSPQEVAP